MALLLFGNDFASMFRGFITDIKTFFGETWDLIYSFLAQYFSEPMIYLFVGGIVLAVALIFILNVINKK